MAQATLDQLLLSMRKRIGNPDLRDAPDRELTDFLQHAYEWAAAEFDLVVTTDTTTLALVADTQEYTYPSDLLVVLWVEWNGSRLTPKTVFEWDRSGVDWRGAESGTPREFALQGRKLILYPKPNAAAVASDSAATVRYYAQGGALATSSTAATPLGEGDQQLVVERAAWAWNSLRAGDEKPVGPAAAARARANEAAFTQLLVQAKRRWHQQIAAHQSPLAVTTRRNGAAR